MASTLPMARLLALKTPQLHSQRLVAFFQVFLLLVHMETLRFIPESSLLPVVFSYPFIDYGHGDFKMASDPNAHIVAGMSDCLWVYSG